MCVEVPQKSPDAGGSGQLRLYQTWKGSNVFLFRGRLIFGPDVRSVLWTVILIVAPVPCFCVFIARKLMDEYSKNIGISVMVVAVLFTIWVLVLLLLTAGTDPGIVPRNAHPPLPEGFDGSSEFGTGRAPPFHLPRTRNVVLNDIPVKVKSCDTCMLYRPLRTSHCSICDNCIERCDHHCPYFGQCIGLRNYKFYFMFLCSATLLHLCVFSFCWVFVVRISNRETASIRKAMAKYPASIALIIYTIILSVMAGALTGYHLYLISKNMSTIDHHKHRYPSQNSNPFNKGVTGNFMEVFFTSIPPSKNNFRAKVQIEPEIQIRVVGSSSSGSNMEELTGDLEAGLKLVSEDSGTGLHEIEVDISTNDRVNKHDECDEESPDLNRIQSLPDVDAMASEAGHFNRESTGDNGSCLSSAMKNVQ
ncbi:hypothetical protein DCAR_0208477 [Daucus carota subsp. sativus]|uniref:S-acyltransferase n=1 Tax=Daucus carota subsp. sativus TaxID=79200 RepID=A0AAF0WFZ7_DAUCS|nr:PREDICTED: probable protein S-acyltransferase 7 [Daucus carota subsp. sativus]WOG89240.1 hypothetical protein DCAR_0208477 [Daucus carota subsp. sativus]